MKAKKRTASPKNQEETLKNYRENLRWRNPKLDAKIENGQIVAVDVRGKPLIKWGVSKK